MTRLVTLRKMSVALGLEEDSERFNKYISAQTMHARRCEVINIADERNPLSLGLEVKPWPQKLCPTDLPSYASDADLSGFTYVRGRRLGGGRRRNHHDLWDGSVMIPSARS